MWNRVFWFSMVLLIFSACSKDEGIIDDNPLQTIGGSDAITSPNAGVPGGNIATAGLGGAAGTNAVAGEPAPTGETSGTSGKPAAGSGGTSGKPGGESGKTGGSAGKGDKAGNGSPTAGTTNGGDVVVEPDDGVPNASMEPIIPELTGEPCPEFRDNSSEMIGTMLTRIRAGTPGPEKGALLFAFHFTSGQSLEAMGGVAATAQTEIVQGGGIVAAPQSEFRGDVDIAVPTNTWFNDDLLWVDHVVSCAVANNNIDPKRIYAVGCSAGGLMAGTLGLMRSEYMAAVAPNSGGIHWPASYTLSNPSHAPSVMTLCGGAADNVIINFCDSSSWMHEQIIDIAQSGGFIVNCNHGAGHCGGVSLAPLAWEFLKAHPYGVNPEPYKDGLPSNFPPFCEIVWPGAG